MKFYDSVEGILLEIVFQKCCCNQYEMTHLSFVRCEAISIDNDVGPSVCMYVYNVHMFYVYVKMSNMTVNSLSAYRSSEHMFKMQLVHVC